MFEKMKKILIILVIINVFIFLFYDQYLSSSRKTYTSKPSALVLCNIISTEPSITQTALDIWRTWAHKCTHAQFICLNCNTLKQLKFKTYKNYPILLKIVNLPFISLNTTSYLSIFKYIYRFNGYKFEWILFTTDKTYVFTRNLYNLINSNPTNNDKISYGNLVSDVFLFNRKSLKKIYQIRACSIKLKNCFKNNNISLSNLKDKFGKEKFKGVIEIYNNSSCCSDETISFNLP